MKVKVEAERCQGHARCAMICPEVFDLDEEGFVVLLAEEIDDPVVAGRVRDAVANCPERAIDTV